MNKFLAIMAIVVVVGGGAWLAVDPGHVPIFDADLNRLAETSAEGYCSGIVFWNTNAMGDAKAAEVCRAETGRPTAIDLRIVQRSFCIGATDAGFTGGVDACLDIIEDQQGWPTYDGGLSQAWTKAYPYPGGTFRASVTDGVDYSRTGDREGIMR